MVMIKIEKIMKVIEIITDIKTELMDFRDKKDQLARETLQSEFDIVLNDTLQGNYSVKIDSNYKINILDNDTNRDVTSVLSTGQNVVISLTFINALIATAKKIIYYNRYKRKIWSNYGCCVVKPR